MNNCYRAAIWINAVFMLSTASGQEFPTLFETPKKSLPSDRSLDELRNGVKARYNNIRAIDANYKITSNTNGDLTEVDLRYAWKGEKRLRETQDFVLATQGDFEEQFLPEFKAASVSAEKQPITDQDPFMQAMGFPLTDTERASVNNTDFLLPYALFDTRLDWAVLPELETVDGVDCHVVRANTAQRIWIDVKSQFAVRFRQLHFRIENVSSEEWPIGIQYRFKDFGEVDGIPMPYKCMMVSCGTPSDPKSLWGKPLRSSVIVVDNLSLNEEEKGKGGILRLLNRPWLSTCT